MCLRLSPGRRPVCEIDAPVWIFNLLHRAFDTEWMWNRLFIFLCLCWMWDCISICLCLCCLYFLCLFFLFGFASIKPLILAGCLVRCSRSRNLVCQDLGWFDYSLLFYLAEKGQQRIRLVWICIHTGHLLMVSCGVAGAPLYRLMSSYIALFRHLSRLTDVKYVYKYI